MPVKKTKTTKKSSAARAPRKRFYHHHFPMIPLGSWLLFWFFILITILFSTVCFTNVLDTTGRYTTSTATNGSSLVTQRALEAQVAELQTQVAKKESCGFSNVTWNSNPAERTISYTDPKTGVQMSLPYNFNWGAGKNPLYPYTVSENEIYFGPAKASGDCILIRDSYLVISAKSASINDTRKALNNAQEAKPTNMQERTVNGIQVLSYTFNRGAGDEKEWIAFGRTNQYTIHSDGWLTDAEAIKIIQSLKVVK